MMCIVGFFKLVIHIHFLFQRWIIPALVFHLSSINRTERWKKTYPSLKTRSTQRLPSLMSGSILAVHGCLATDERISNEARHEIT